MEKTKNCQLRHEITELKLKASYHAKYCQLKHDFKQLFAEYEKAQNEIAQQNETIKLFQSQKKLTKQKQTGRAAASAVPSKL